MFCTNCGKETPEGSKFCAQCGNKIVGIANDTLKSDIKKTQNKKDILKQDGVFVRGNTNTHTAQSLPTDNNQDVNDALEQYRQSKRVNREPDTAERFVQWLSEDWLMKLGALLVLLAMGWFTQYAFTNGWIGNVGKISLGLLVGAGVLAGGYYRSIVYKHQGGVLLALGATIILLVMFAAREIYDFFTPASSLIIMFGTVAFTMLASVRFNNKALAVGSVALAALAPLLTNSPEPSFIGLFSYLGIVTVASLAVVFFTGWREIILENFIIISLFSIPYIAQSYKLFGYEVYIAFIFALFFFITSTVGILKAPKSTISSADLVTAFGTGIFLFTWTLAGIAKDLQTMVLLGWALIFMIASFLTYTATKRTEPFILYGGVAAALIAFATAITFSGAALMMAYTAEVAIATIVAALLTHSRAVASNTSLLFGVPILMSFPYLFSGQWSHSVVFEGALAIYFLMIVLVGVAFFIISFLPLPEDAEADKITMPLTLLAVFAGYFLLLIWVIPHALFFHSMGTTVSLLIYTALGLTLYTTAKGKYEHTMHRLGQILLVGVVARLLLIDVWNLNLTGRIITFALVGVALIATAFVKRGHKNK